VLGARLALAGAAWHGIEVPDQQKRLRLVVETDRCSFDAIQAVTGCSVGRGTLAIQDHGKLAATFFDDHAMNGLRVAVRPGLRTDVTPPDVSDDQRHAVQRRAYIELPDNELFTMRPVPYLARASRDPVAHARRFDCRGCGEEVLATFAAAEGLCKPCAGAGFPLAESKASRG
jgi:formylmethanofuran dehydrogenase subunit E